MSSHMRQPSHPARSSTSKPQPRRAHWRILSEELRIPVKPSSSEEGGTPFASATLLMDESAGLALRVEFHSGPPTAEVYRRMVLTTYARRRIGPLSVHFPDTPAGRTAAMEVKKVIHPARRKGSSRTST